MSQAVSGAVNRGTTKAREKMSRARSKIRHLAETVSDQDRSLWLRRRMRLLLHPSPDSANSSPRKLAPINGFGASSLHPAPSSITEEESSDENANRATLGGIQDQEFDACEDLLEQDEPGPDWELLSDLATGRVWRKQDANSNACIYRAYAKMAEPLSMMVQALTDIERRKDWDQYCLDIREQDRIGETSVIYWRVKFPFPLSDRDYVYYRRAKHLPSGDVVVLSRSAPADSHAEVPGVVRVDDFRTRCALRPTADGGVDYRMEYWEEQKGNIPQWAVRWGMDKAVDSMLEGMRKHMKLLSE